MCESMPLVDTTEIFPQGRLSPRDNVEDFMKDHLILFICISRYNSAHLAIGESEELFLTRILVVEDHKKLLHSLERGLKSAGYDVVAVDTGEAGFYYANTEPIDAVVLDVMLPGRSGLEILRDLRKSNFAAPVLILSAKDTVSDRIRGLDQGADDYLVKPFAFEELLARIRAQLNRTIPGRCVRMNAADLEMHIPTHTVRRAGIEIDLSKQEFRLLEYLLRHKNETVTRDALARDVWGEPGGVSTNVVDVYINALRKKLERPGLKKLIRTIRGSGYSLIDESKYGKEDRNN
jgi:DNA-binding response OmpR family regulator